MRTSTHDKGISKSRVLALVCCPWTPGPGPKGRPGASSHLIAAVTAPTPTGHAVRRFPQLRPERAVVYLRLRTIFPNGSIYAPLYFFALRCHVRAKTAVQAPWGGGTHVNVMCSFNYHGMYSPSASVQSRQLVVAFRERRAYRLTRYLGNPIIEAPCLSNRPCNSGTHRIFINFDTRLGTHNAF